MLDDVDDVAETGVEKVDIERMLWLLYLLIEVLVLDIKFRQLLDIIKLELLVNGRPLRILVCDAPRFCCGENDRTSSGCAVC